MTSFDLNAGALAPVADQVSLDGAAIAVEGTIPSDLNGVLVRNGPNPRSGRFDGETMLDWWVGPGMLHGLAIADGQVRWFRNRWHSPQAEAGTRNVNVVGLGQGMLALGEGEVPIEVSRQLEPLGPTTFGGALPNGMNAHPKFDPKSGLLRFFRADWQPPFLQVGAIDDNWHLYDLREVPVDRPVMMHDFAITERFDVVLHLNVVLDPQLLSAGARLPLRWDPELATSIGTVPRDGSPTKWFEIEPCFIQHVVNAYEDSERPDVVVLDAVRYGEFLKFDEQSQQHLPNPLGVLWRYELDTTTGAVVETQLDDRHIELPRIDERTTGSAHRFVYAVEQPSDREMRGLRRYDLTAGTSTTFDLDYGDQNSEPVFVASGPSEDAGWLVSCVYRAASDTTDVVILRAAAIDEPPVATLRLPRRIPAGFHGAWIPLD